MVGGSSEWSPKQNNGVFKMPCHRSLRRQKSSIDTAASGMGIRQTYDFIARDMIEDGRVVSAVLFAVPTAPAAVSRVARIDRRADPI